MWGVGKVLDLLTFAERAVAVGKRCLLLAVSVWV